MWGDTSTILMDNIDPYSNFSVVLNLTSEIKAYKWQRQRWIPDTIQCNQIVIVVWIVRRAKELLTNQTSSSSMQ
jgi:hypothetical protein